ncbi:hypothetical protein HPDFL43_13697 [Hoeflea phototrophica DFL-43]|jgi:uncharacterized protein (DUF1499 family)|uniref:DUF1499 domain-containing protein n=1 Tax=Hoeflea phototrophica (strain DSM 17068 / NCIMB 14078 / DFL-43) TaxID=411684 RepID=A9DH21_HOEPD|nr:DUF1499 domain-containing protein [Hoeflea phototrophica]EDQ31467.1 hypothetical protein HPDFL43_13697 [Hoeflea phototrophica DFL-43]
MLKTILLSILMLIAIASVLFFYVIGPEKSWEKMAGPPDRGPYDFTTAPRSSTANDALACTEGLYENPDFLIAPFDDAPEIVIERLSQRLLASDELARRVDDRSNPAKARFVTHSPIMRFPDMIHIEARPLPNGRTGVMAYAKAQLGTNDLGKNRERLEALFPQN